MSDEALEIRSAAILAIDLQNEYRADGAYPVEDYDRVLARCSAILTAGRAVGVPVVHAQYWVEPEKRRDAPLLEESVTEALRSAVAGSDGAAICAEVAPQAGESLIRKRWPSAFRDTTLAVELRDRGVDHLIVVGVWTDSCVRASVLDAIAAGFRVHLVKDACGSGTATMHRAAVLDMANRLYGGGVVRTAELLKALCGEPYAEWRCTRPIAFPYTMATLDTLYEAL